MIVFFDWRQRRIFRTRDMLQKEHMTNTWYDYYLPMGSLRLESRSSSWAIGANLEFLESVSQMGEGIRSDDEGAWGCSHSGVDLLSVTTNIEAYV